MHWPAASPADAKACERRQLRWKQLHDAGCDPNNVSSTAFGIRARLLLFKTPTSGSHKDSIYIIRRACVNVWNEKAGWGTYLQLPKRIGPGFTSTVPH